MWIWSRRTDLLAFGGSAALALGLAAAGRLLAPTGALPVWAWFAFVLGLDVAHVWTTLFRTYLDPEELARRRSLYLGLPLLCWAAGASLHAVSPLLFWRVLAYAAVFHFVRQQVGWVAIYRARAGERERLDRVLDAAVVYLATGWPLLYWHAHLPRRFTWLYPGDFVDGARLAPLVTPLAVVYLAVLVAYVARAVQLGRRRPPNFGKHLCIAATAVVWYAGIVAVDDDFTFTVTNVTIHAIPYMALLWAYARERAPEVPASPLARVVAGGVAAFLAVALVCAFCEEIAWDHLVWHDGHLGSVRDAPLLGDLARTLVVPLLAVPQAVHYALDGLLWRRKDTGRAQARALGFAHA
jgi:hypothetical protein